MTKSVPLGELKKLSEERMLLTGIEKYLRRDMSKKLTLLQL
jgi:hypothetical protein